MLLTITTTHSPATDLGYLLAKHPARAQRFSLACGAAHVFYPHVADDRCTAALLLDIDVVGLTRRPGRGEQASPLAPYVNDRAYVASSFMSVAIAQVFSSALQGRCRDRQDLADRAIPLVITLDVLPCRGGEAVLRALFEPLGYVVEAQRLPLDARTPAWGDSRYFHVSLSITAPLHVVLSHLYVLLPVLDDEKHYWVGDDEIDKLLRHGEGWLKDHPEHAQIALRYLRHQRGLANRAVERLHDDEDLDEANVDVDGGDADVEGNVRPLPREEAIEQKLDLNTLRLNAVVDEVRALHASRVIDLGCGEGKLLRLLLKEKQLTSVTGVDVSTSSIEVASKRLRLEELSANKRARVSLVQGTLTCRDKRFAGYDVACLVEVIEHLELSRLPALEQVVFGSAHPGAVVVTTPNSEFNARFEHMPAGSFRHTDHRFEWDRATFAAWATRVGERFGYDVRFADIGVVDDVLGPPTQMAVFTQRERTGTTTTTTTTTTTSTTTTTETDQEAT